MTKKDFIAAAAIVRTTEPSHILSDVSARDSYTQKVRSEMAQGFIRLFRLDNPRFDEGRFLEACFPYHGPRQG